MKGKRVITSTLAVLPLAIAVAAVIPPSEGKELIAVNAQTNGADFRNDVIKYELSEPLANNPNTFECRILIEKDVEGEVGNIFSNEIKIDTPTVSYSVTHKGNLRVNWNNYEKNLVFENYDLRTGEWEHVSVVRNPSEGSFEMYVDGVSVQKITQGAGSDIEEFYMEHCIGADQQVAYAPKVPFHGKIAQVTIYSETLSAGEIMRDYKNGGAISGQTRENLIFNGILQTSSVVVEDNSIYQNDAYLASNDFFFEGETFETKDYTLAILPDMQVMTNHHQPALDTISSYIVENAAEKKIAATISVGDMTDGIANGKDWDRQYNKISAVMEKIGTVTPYVVCAGNHDYDNECSTDHSLTHMNNAFPISEISQWDCWGGSQDPDNIINAYYLFELSGVKYLIFSIDFGPSDDTIEWGKRITEQYPDHRIIVVTHGHLAPDGQYTSHAGYGFFNKTSVNEPIEVWDKWLRHYPNIFMTLSGHVLGDSITLEETVGDHGNVVANFMLNGQWALVSNGIEAFVGLFNFDEQNQRIYINYLSTIHKQLYDFHNQFVYSFKGKTPLTSTYYEEAAAEEISREQTLKALAEGAGIFGEVLPEGEKPVSLGLILGVGAIAATAGIVTAVAVKRRRKDQ